MKKIVKPVANKKVVKPAVKKVVKKMINAQMTFRYGSWHFQIAGKDGYEKFDMTTDKSGDVYYACAKATVVKSLAGTSRDYYECKLSPEVKGVRTVKVSGKTFKFSKE